MSKINIELGQKWNCHRYHYYEELINIQLRLGYTPGVLVFGETYAHVTYNLLSYVAKENGFPIKLLSIKESYRCEDRQKAISELKDLGANFIIGIYQWCSVQCLRESSSSQPLLECAEHLNAYPPTPAEGFELLITIDDGEDE